MNTNVKTFTETASFTHKLYDETHDKIYYMDADVLVNIDGYYHYNMNKYVAIITHEGEFFDIKMFGSRHDFMMYLADIHHDFSGLY